MSVYLLNVFLRVYMFETLLNKYSIAEWLVSFGVIYLVIPISLSFHLFIACNHKNTYIYYSIKFDTQPYHLSRHSFKPRHQPKHCDRCDVRASTVVIGHRQSVIASCQCHQGEPDV